MIFLTVGSLFPFDRLVKAVDEFISIENFQEEIFGQIGKTQYQPKNFEYIDVLHKEAYDQYVLKSSAMISHAGMGTISMAMNYHKPLLVLPRLKQYGEVVNGHQEITAEYFEKDGHILLAKDESQVPRQIGQLLTFKPKERMTTPQNISSQIASFLKSQF